MSTPTEKNYKNPPRQLNENNKLLDKKFIIKLFKKLGINREPIDMNYYQRAFVHKSYIQSENTINCENDDIGEENIGGSIENIDAIDNMVPFQEHSYERLEYMGDAVLNKVAAYYVFSRFQDQDEGFLTTLRTKLVRSQTLAKLALHLKLQKYLLISKYIEDKCNGRKNPKILEDVFESLIGAIYLDFGPEQDGDHICMQFIIKIFETYVDITRMIRVEDNYKRVLLEYFQPKFKTEPRYQIISMRGTNNNREYTMGALAPTGEIIGIGTSKKKREAENIASKKALIYYGVDVDGSESSSSSESSESISIDTSSSSSS